VKSVGEFDQQHAPVLGHGDEHLADGGRLLLLLGVELQAVELGDAVDDRGDLIAELLASHSLVMPVSSTASCNRAAVIVASSRPRSAAISATAIGCVT